MNGVSHTKLKSFAAIALLSTLLLFPTVASSSGEPSRRYLLDDGNHTAAKAYRGNHS